MSGVMSVVRGGRSLVGLPNRFVSKRRGLEFDLDLHEAIDGCLYLVHDYEPELTKAFSRLVRPGNVVLDIGANVGAHTLNLAVLVGDEGKVHAFEATEFALAKLRRNLTLNPLLSDRVSVEAIYLNDGSAPAPEEISASWNIAKGINDPGRSRLDGGFASKVIAQPMTLDQWIEDRGMSQVDAIKLDVDGGEVEVLRGASRTLRRFRPIVFMELSPIHFEKHRYRFEDQVSALLDLRYEFYTLEGERLPSDPTVLKGLIPYGSLVNVLGVPV